MTAASLVCVAIFLPAFAALVLLLVARRLGSATGYLTVGTMVVESALIFAAWSQREAGSTLTSEWQWVPSLGMNLSILVDGLSLFHGSVICLVGVLVCWYATFYLGPKYKGHGRFYACLMFFVTAMLGTVFSGNILLMFLFWEITGVASFLLIGFFHADPEAQAGARRALLTTAGTGLLLLAGLIMLGLAAGSYVWSDMITGPVASGRPEWWLTASMVLIACGIFGKSAQFPFHYWLPGAMVAPTPVSVYLHSATMVKLGVFLTARVFPIFHENALWFPLLGGVCFFTMLFGAWLALRSNDLKAILAFSTISQLGMMIGIYGLGALGAVRFDYLIILAHVFYKAALFMVAGIVDHATGTRDVRKLGGLASRMPVLTIGAAISCAALAGLPLTAGFLSKESLLGEIFTAREGHPLAASLILAAVVLSAIFSVAVAARIFFGVFLGKEREGSEFHAPGWKMALPVMLLSAGTLLLGTYPAAFQALFDGLRVQGLHEAKPVVLTIWHGFNIELATSAVGLVLGWGLYRWEQRREWCRASIPRLLRFQQGFDLGLDALGRGSKKLTLGLLADWPPAYLPIVIAFLLAAVGATALTSGWEGTLPETLSWSFHPLRIAVVLLISVAALGVVFLRRWTSQLVALSLAGFFTTLYFVLSKAPDLAMTQILVESASVVMILLLLARFPSSSQRSVRLELGWGLKPLTKVGLSIGVGLLMGGLVLYVEPNRHPEPSGPRYVGLSEPFAEGSNVVNTILVDFRGFDTMGEITVILTAALGSLGLMMRYRRTRKDHTPPPGFLLGTHKEP